MVDWITMVLKESLLGSFGIIRTIVIIIIPIMIILQLMLDYKLLEKLSAKTKSITNFLGISKDSLIPLLIGGTVGVSYGAGAIIFAKEKYGLSKDDIFLTMCFLLPLHAVIETTMVFWLIGVNPVFTLGSRIVVALTGILFFKRRIQKRKVKEQTLNRV